MKQYSLKTKSGEDLSPTCTAIANCGEESELKVLLLSSKRPNTVFVFDPKLEEVAEEWELGTDVVTLSRCRAATGKLVAAGENKLIVIDTALADTLQVIVLFVSFVCSLLFLLCVCVFFSFAQKSFH